MTDDLLPAEMHRLRRTLLQALPGVDAQLRMAHISRIPLTPIPHDVRHAAVLILLFPNTTGWHLVLIRRKPIAGDIHAGQISFPGGRTHSGESPEEAALRESAEEIGSPAQQIVTLGRLTSLHIPVSNHLVFPVVGFAHTPAIWTMQETEVDAVYEVPVSAFLDPQSRILSNVRVREGMILRDVPCYAVQDQLVWGATAMILSEFTEVWRKAGEDE